MDKFEFKTKDIPFPIIKSDVDGKITYKNNAARNDKHLKLKRSVVGRDEKDRAEYASCFGERKCVFRSMTLGSKKRYCFAIFSQNECRWYFSRSLERSLLLLRNASIEDRVAKLFSEAEEMLLSGKELPEAFGSVASKPWTDAIIDNMTIESYYSVLTLVSRLLFGEDRFSASFNEKGLKVLSPKRAFIAAGAILRLMMEDATVSPSVYCDDGRILLSDGKFCFDCGELSTAELVRAVPPFVCSKIEAISATSGAYAAELFFGTGDVIC